MRIATWNVNSLNARLDYLLDFLATRAPDVLCVQELKLADDAFPWVDVEAAGYHAVVHGQKSWNGVAVLAKSQPKLLEAGLPGQAGAGARVVTAEVDGLSVTSVYVPNGKEVGHADFPMKIAWLAALADYAEALTRGDLPVVVGGDFNLCPGDLDSWDPAGFAGHIFHTDAERGAYRRLLDAGLVDVFRAANPSDPGYSWWDYRAGAFHKGMGLRIDLLLASPSLAAAVGEVSVDRDFRKKREGRTPSDHAPVVADLDTPPSS